MDSDDLKTFITVHRSGGFSHAAEILGRSQPAISRRIALLEEELSVPLFERVPGRSTLSQAGRVLIPYAERALAAMQDAEAAVRALVTGEAGPVSLAIVGTLAGTELTASLRAFAEDHPKVDLALRTASSAEISDLVRNGEAVIGLRYELDRSSDLDCEQLGAERLVIACAKDHPKSGRSLGKLAELRAERWIAFPEIPGKREITASHIFALFLTHGLGEVGWLPVDSLTAQKRLVEAGFGLALVPESSIAEELAHGTIGTISVRDLNATRPIAAVTRKGGFLSLAAKRLLDILKARYAST
jgi:DNA-binding transcriptional LysR family regulator